MQTDRSAHRVVALALGTAAIFDVTGAVIYRVLRAGLPVPPPPGSALDPFQQSTSEIQDAHHEAIMRARVKNGASFTA